MSGAERQETIWHEVKDVGPCGDKDAIRVHVSLSERAGALLVGLFGDGQVTVGHWEDELVRYSAVKAAVTMMLDSAVNEAARRKVQQLEDMGLLGVPEDDVGIPDDVETLPFDLNVECIGTPEDDWDA